MSAAARGGAMRRRVAWCAAIVLLAFLSIYQQPNYPATWLDEGFVLQGAANLATFGRYALRSSEGFRPLDQPLLANGPGVVVPIAAAFAVVGAGLLQARLVMAATVLVAAFLFAWLAKRLYGEAAALISLGLLLAVPAQGFLFYGRQALGNIPALAYFLGGYLFWVQGLERRRPLWSVLAGALFGLAMVTKSQYYVVGAALLAYALLSALTLRAAGWRPALYAGLGAAAVLAAWLAVQAVTLGPAGFAAHVAALRSSSRVTIMAFRPMRIPGSAWYLVRSGMALFVAPAWAYAAWRCWKERGQAHAELLLVVLLPIWVCWYLLASVGWPRYALDPYLIGLLLTGRAALAAVGRLREYRGPANWPGRGVRLRFAGLAAVLLVAFCWGLGGLLEQAAQVVARPDRFAQAFADYITTAVDRTVVVESWEWELDALTDLTYHHPTNDWVDRYTAWTQFGDAVTMQYAPAAYRPGFLVVGPFAKWTGIYDGYLAQGCCILEHTSGPYDLYRVRE